MERYKEEFIEFMVDSDVLKFGDFVTKSGRKTPFFVNTGFYRTGAQLRKLGGYYAKAIHDKFGLDFDVLFGPAYKGIPLSVAASMAISEKYDKDVKYCSNRKEIKDHGDKGILLGSPLGAGDKVLLIEDVTTAGYFYRRDAADYPRPGRCAGLRAGGQRGQDGARQRRKECPDGDFRDVWFSDCGDRDDGGSGGASV